MEAALVQVIDQVTAVVSDLGIDQATVTIGLAMAIIGLETATGQEITGLVTIDRVTIGQAITDRVITGQA